MDYITDIIYLPKSSIKNFLYILFHILSWKMNLICGLKSLFGIGGTCSGWMIRIWDYLWRSDICYNKSKRVIIKALLFEFWKSGSSRKLWWKTPQNPLFCLRHCFCFFHTLACSFCGLYGFWTHFLFKNRIENCYS